MEDVQLPHLITGQKGKHLKTLSTYCAKSGLISQSGCHDHLISYSPGPALKLWLQGWWRLSQRHVSGVLRLGWWRVSTIPVLTFHVDGIPIINLYRWFIALQAWNNLVLYVYHESYLPVTSIFIAYLFFVSASMYRVPKVQLFVQGSWIQLLVVGGRAIHLENDGVRQLGWWTSWTSQLNRQMSINMFQTTNQYQQYYIHIRFACVFPHMR